MDHDAFPFPLPAVPPQIRKQKEAQQFSQSVFNDFFSFPIARARQKLAKTSAGEWEHMGQQYALRVFHAAARRVPAYRNFLEKQQINAEKIRTFTDFLAVPPVDKKSYINQYPIDALSWDGNGHHAQMTSVSSGSSGKPFLWPRDTRLELEVTYLFELIFDTFFNRPGKRTLIVDCFAMGMYVGGPFFLNAHLRIAQKGYEATLVTPGNVIDDILRVIQELTPQFNQVILSGYPPFLKDILENGQEVGIDWSTMRTILYPAGESFSEAWRAAVAELAGNASQFINFLGYYGTADAAVLGVETPWSIALRKRASENSQYIVKTFGQNRLPAVMQYIPTLRYLEVIANEIHFTTANGAIPLVRYNIHDSGGLMTHDQVATITANRYAAELKKLKIGLPWQLPYVYVFGRSDHTVVLYGANIYPENIKTALETGLATAKCSGRFVMEVEEDHQYNQHFNIHFECQRDVRPSQELKLRLGRSITQVLEEINAEYANVRRAIGDRAIPHIFLHGYGDKRYFPRQSKQPWKKKD